MAGQYSHLRFFRRTPNALLARNFREKRGEIVEFGSVIKVYGNPKHGYTRELLAAVPGRNWSHGRDALAVAQ